jgi:predicted dehydrogenase
MPDKLRVGLVGLGWVSSQYVKGFQANPHCAIRAVCVRDRARGEQALRRYGIEQCEVYVDLERMIGKAELDLVCILTPNHLHAAQAIICAEAGKHLIIEKPAALNWAEAVVLRNRLRSTPVKNIMGYVLRWNPLFRTVKEILAREMIGRVFHIEVDYMLYLDQGLQCYPWCSRKEKGGSILMQSGCHAVDGLFFFAGKSVQEVAAYSSKNRPDFDHQTTYVVLLRFTDGATGKLLCTYDTRHPYLFDFNIYGDKGSIRKNLLYCRETFPGQADWIPIPTVLPDTENVEHHPFPQMVDYFVDCIRNDLPASPSVEDGMQVFEVIEAAERSAARGGRPVRLPLH